MTKHLKPLFWGAALSALREAGEPAPFIGLYAEIGMDPFDWPELPEGYRLHRSTTRNLDPSLELV